MTKAKTKTGAKILDGPKPATGKDSRPGKPAAKSAKELAKKTTPKKSANAPVSMSAVSTSSRVTAGDLVPEGAIQTSAKITGCVLTKDGRTKVTLSCIAFTGKELEKLGGYFKNNENLTMFLVSAQAGLFG